MFGYQNDKTAFSITEPSITEYLDNRIVFCSVIELANYNTSITEFLITEHLDNRTNEMFGYRIYLDNWSLVIEVLRYIFCLFVYVCICVLLFMLCWSVYMYVRIGEQEKKKTEGKCIHTYTHTHRFTHTHAHTHTYTHTFTHTFTHTHIHIYTHITYIHTILTSGH